MCFVKLTVRKCLHFDRAGICHINMTNICHINAISGSKNSPIQFHAKLFFFLLLQITILYSVVTP